LNFSYLLGYNTVNLNGMKKSLYGGIFVSLVAGSLSATAQSVDTSMYSNLVKLEEIKVVGTRNENRTVLQTPVPVDVLPMATLSQQVGQLDINQILQFSIPSFNANKQSGSDGSDHVDPVTLRGMGPDQTLVLVNGKRRHQSSLVNIYGTRGRGNTGSDMNALPTTAIDRIEVLRDGASAQYGSDAIAGVINIVTKKNKGTTLTQAFGVASRGDGGSSLTGLNTGFDLAGGWVNVTAEYSSKAKTFRDAGDYRVEFGDASSTNAGLWLNSEIPVGAMTFYNFGGVNNRVGDAYAWTRDAGSDRNIPSIYPDGFSPLIQATIGDMSWTTGLRGELAGWNADFYASVGRNNFDYWIHNTLNRSMGPTTPKEFKAGGFGLGQNLAGTTWDKYFGESGHGVNVAVGLEARQESYYIYAGEEGSWQTYDSDYPGGSQGFPGFRPSNELNEGRNNVGAFLDVEWDVSDRLMIGGAARFENYSDFGQTTNGKLAARYAINEKFAIRGSFSTGFRAPSLAQLYFNSTFTNFVSGVAVESKLANNADPITSALGISALKQETAQNMSFGFTAAPARGITLTVDGYSMDVKDRVVLTGGFGDDDPDVGSILQAQNVSYVQFFTNAVDTRTTGVDIVATYAKNLAGGMLNTSLALNVNNMTIDRVYTNDQLTGKEDSYFGRREQLFLLASAPPMKANVGVNYTKGKWFASLRGTYFDRIVIEDWVGTDDVYDPRLTLDLSLSYALGAKLRATVGVNNLTDQLPTFQDSETETGGMYDAVQMGTMGRFFFGRITYSL